MATSGITLPFVSTNEDRPSILGFTPRLAALSEVVGWWVPSEDKVTLSAGDVSTWADRSDNGNNATQATASARFTWSADGGSGGRPCMVTDRANNSSMACGSIMPTGAGAKWSKVISVFAPTTVGSSEQHDFMSGSLTGSTSTGIHRINIRNTNQLYCRVGIDSARAEITGTPIFGEWMLLINTWNDDDKKVRLSINGGTFTESSTVSGAECGDAALQIGRVATGNAFNGKIGPAFLCNVDLSKSTYSGLLNTIKDFYRQREKMTVT